MLSSFRIHRSWARCRCHSLCFRQAALESGAAQTLLLDSCLRTLQTHLAFRSLFHPHFPAASPHSTSTQKPSCVSVTSLRLLKTNRLLPCVMHGFHTAGQHNATKG